MKEIQLFQMKAQTEIRHQTWVQPSSRHNRDPNSSKIEVFDTERALNLSLENGYFSNEN